MTQATHGEEMHGFNIENAMDIRAPSRAASISKIRNIVSGFGKQHNAFKLGPSNSDRYFRAEEYSVKMLEEMRALDKVKSELRQALRLQQFILYAQPQVCLRNSCVHTTGFELLVRWGHPKQGLIAPKHFICHAEQTGLVQNIDFWMLQQAVSRIQSWMHCPDRKHLRLSVNVSRLHFSDPSFPKRVSAITRNCPEIARRLTLEVTETMVLTDLVTAQQVMMQIREMGFCLSLDDFGSGYSSLDLIRQLPFNEIKIDQSFVRDLPTDLRGGQIVENMIQLAKALKVNVIAEGVETHDQLGWLVDHGCHSAQGYLFGLPSPLFQ